jgi:hypothetical protein
MESHFSRVYNLAMKPAIYCVLFAGLSLFAQTTPSDQAGAKLDSILSAMQNPGASANSLSRQLADVILSLARPDRQPSRGTVVAFTDELTAALIGKDLKWNAPPRWLLGSISEILSASGANFTKASRLGDTLNGLGVDPSKIQGITTLFIKIGEEVRGPDDLRVWRKILK